MDRSHYEDRPDPRQMEIWNRMTIEKKFAIVEGMRNFALEARRTRMRALHPEWTADQVNREARDWLSQARDP